MNRREFVAALSVLPAVVRAQTSPAGAADWPEWRGRGRLGVWTETGILEKFPEKGLDVLWRTPVHAGYSGAAVTGGRVFVSDFQSTQRLRGIERILVLDEKNGRVLWSKQWEASYVGLSDTWAIGPAATPTVDGEIGRASCRERV